MPVAANTEQNTKETRLVLTLLFFYVCGGMARIADRTDLTDTPLKPVVRTTCALPPAP